MDENTLCKRGCCWTRLGVCAKKRNGIYRCLCHNAADVRARKEAAEQRAEDLARGDRWRVTNMTRKTV